jgi:hypothetical protein
MDIVWPSIDCTGKTGSLTWERVGEREELSLRSFKAFEIIHTHTPL